VLFGVYIREYISNLRYQLLMASQPEEQQRLVVSHCARLLDLIDLDTVFDLHFNIELTYEEQPYF